jgi:acyl-CoA synthetase (AMP-forming)/AMP-acid ligase II
MKDDLLRNPNDTGHLLAAALKRHKGKPVLFLGDTTLTGGQLADRISQYVRAFEALGAGTGATAAVLSLNRPEVLMMAGASQTQGFRRTPLHPLGSLDDHAYVLADAGVTSLVIDPNPMFVERARRLLDKVDSLKQILTIGPVPAGLADVSTDLAAATAETFRDGWLHTGDLAREDEDGFWFIVDRTKDMIVTGGFNVFPREGEDVVAEHSAIAQVCVIGTPDEKWGEAVTAVVVLRPDAASDEASVATMTSAIQAAVEERKGSVQSPKQVVVVDSLPLTALGKPDKKAVRAKFWEGADRAVG